MKGWEEHAACSGMSVSSFTVSELGDADVGHISDKDMEKYKKLKKFNSRKIDRAKKICATCPVQLECYDSADSASRYWCVRGGMTPQRYVNQVERRRAGRSPVVEMDEYLEFRCLKGHLGDGYRGTKFGIVKGVKRKYWYCKECDALSTARARARAKMSK